MRLAARTIVELTCYQGCMAASGGLSSSFEGEVRKVPGSTVIVCPRTEDVRIDDKARKRNPPVIFFFPLQARTESRLSPLCLRWREVGCGSVDTNYERKELVGHYAR